MSVGRPKGSKNINPYPMTDAVIRKMGILNSRIRIGVPHTEAYKEHMSRLTCERIKMNGKSVSYKGIFTPKNPAKYVGNVKNIVYRSGWELKIMHQLDQSPGVIEWASEELVIRYYDPVRERFRRYFPDFLVKSKTKDGFKNTIIEIKPDYQTNLRAAPRRKTKQYLQEVMDVATNQAKWTAAKAFADEQGWEFVVLTEKNFSF
jgi:hypothetical protein